VDRRCRCQQAEAIRAFGCWPGDGTTEPISVGIIQRIDILLNLGVHGHQTSVLDETAWSSRSSSTWCR
jgi:hypothetical protein